MIIRFNKCKPQLVQKYWSDQITLLLFREISKKKCYDVLLQKNLEN